MPVMTVELFYTQGAVMLRSKGSELLILPEYIEHLQTLKDPKLFIEYFRKEALLNRPARKLFIAWERKDPSLWNELYSIVHKNVGNKDSVDSEKAEGQA